MQLTPSYDPWADSQGYVFNRAKAHAAMTFFHKKLSHAKGEKARTWFYLEPWQQAVIGNTFGWVHADTKLRRYREVFLYVPRKNGKTPLAAGILMLLLFQDGEYGAEIYSAAHDYKQACLLFAHIRMMVQHNPTDFEERTRKIYSGQDKAIQLDEPDGYATYRPIVYDPEAAQGMNLLAVAVDELHTHPDRRMVDALIGGTAGKAEPLIVYLTTADYERPGSICNEKHDYAKQVRDGVLNDPGFLPVIYEAGKDADWTSEDVWAAANPNLGISVQLEYLRRECKRAMRDPVYENTFKRFHLNIRTEQAERWLSVKTWDNCQEEIDWASVERFPCYLAFDLASTRDTTALAYLFMDGKEMYLQVEYWAPRVAAEEREDRDKVPYLTWARNGYMTLTRGERTDFRDLLDRIVEAKTVRHLNIAGVVYDPHEAGQLARELETEHGFELTAFAQTTNNYNEPTRRFEDAIIDRLIHHDGNPVLRWQISNVGLYTDRKEHIMPVKSNDRAKIDGVVAGIMALALSMKGGSKASVYAGRGVLRV